ncbi:MAG: hypothetical protein BZY82_09660 [SAR202 cluster bacterium Io17-Chloro-G3]|nr:MAG: hypothetical protein BZY82_09660 [SAR202 cluster bacterium Io17-Chloro-G3]
MEPMKILVTANVSDAQVKRIRSISPDLEVLLPKTPEESEAQLGDTDVILGRFTPEIFRKARSLKWLQTSIAGADFLLFEEFAQSPIPLVTAKGIVGTHLAEQAWALILGLTRGVGLAVRNRQWETRRAINSMASELSGKTLGVVGLGGTGIEVAKRALAFDMEVVAIKRTKPSDTTYVSRVWGPEKLYELLEISDVVVLCLPLTKRTRGMFDLEAFRHMRPSSLLINVGRGETVVETALLQALQEGQIAGAGLDVLPTEPLPDNHPLWDMENVIITPHVAGDSPLRSERVVDLFCANLQRYAAGLPLMGLVDKQEGY